MTTKKPSVPAKADAAPPPAERCDADFSAFAGAGLENVTSADVLIPRLTILQALSPQINKRKPEYVEGAEQGMICDVGTGELFPDGVVFIPCYYSKVYLEWFPRDTGKGLATIHTSAGILDETARNERNQPILPNGNYISETAQFFGLNLSADGRRSFIPMSSTMLKRARRWLTLATGEKLKRADGSSFTPPLFYRSYMLTTVEDGNSEGDWFSWKIERGPAMPELEDWRGLMDECKSFVDSLVAGKVKGDIAPPDEAGSEQAM
jgi:hypothetical protein